MTDDATDNVVAFAGPRTRLDEVQDSEYIERMYDKAHRVRSLADAADLAADFLEKDHGIDTIVHAIALAAVAAASAVANSQQGRALGADKSVQAHNLAAWKFIEEFGGFDDGPKRLLQYRKMLYPRFDKVFAKTIDRNTMNWLIDEAKATLASGRELHSSVRFHLEGIAAGIPPFQHEVVDDE